MDRTAIIGFLAGTRRPIALTSIEVDDVMVERAAGVLHTMFCAKDCPHDLGPWRENARLILTAALEERPL